MSRFSFRPWFAHLGVLLLALVGLVAPIGRSGVWDPYELDTAELARKIAVRLFGASSLAVPGDPPTLPTLTDLGMGELPFTSMALSYRVFGWHDWSGRLPLALWGVVGVMSLYVLVARYVDRRAAVYSALALVTMPLYFMQARTMLGDIVTMAAFAMALAGLTAFVLESAWNKRAVGLTVGALGLLSGYLSRGLLFGLAAPLLSVGLALVFAGHSIRFSPFRNVAALSLLGLGVGAAAQFFVTALPLVELVEPLRRDLGMQLFDPSPRDSTFDRPLRQIGHALFPWSALLPFALGRLLRAPLEVTELGARERQAAVRLVLLSAAGVTLAAGAAVAPYAGPLPYIGVAALAGAVGVAIRDFERGASASRVVAVGSALLGVVLFVDLKREPVRMLATFSNDGIAFPASSADASETRLLIVTALFLGVLCMAWFFRPAPVSPTGSASHSYGEARAWLAARLEAGKELWLSLGDIWKGNLLFVFVVIQAALVGLGAMLFIGSRAGWASVGRMPRNFVSVGLNAWWAPSLLIALGIVSFVVVRDAFDFTLKLVKLHRATAVVIAGALSGFILSFSYYPAVAGQLSPKEVFETFGEAHAPTDELAVLGMSPRSASFYFPGAVASFDEPNQAFPWLIHDSPTRSGDSSAKTSRRWVVLRARDLPKMNALYRAKRKTNLPVLDARSSQVLLVSDALGDRANQNPLDDLVRSERPRVQHPLAARFSDELELIGWDTVSETGKLVESIVPGKPYTLRFYYRVQKPIGGNWQSFVHVDGQGRRHNADHAVLDGRYPMNLWQPGDYVRDDTEITLEPNFLPGAYNLYFGFFNSSQRMKVTEGPANEDRVVGGALHVL